MSRSTAVLDWSDWVVQPATATPGSMQIWIDPRPGPSGAMTAIDVPVNVIVAVAPVELTVWSFPPYAALSLVSDQAVE
jgi:hypothetical protein